MSIFFRSLQEFRGHNAKGYRAEIFLESDESRRPYGTSPLNPWQVHVKIGSTTLLVGELRDDDDRFGQDLCDTWRNSWFGRSENKEETGAATIPVTSDCCCHPVPSHIAVLRNINH
ncbi:hypothetical protein LOAG_04124 [Loa loa]|uniref:Uncharacterized protein n=1 Tax=Loa loa TaxID=7209 RepID=A0A1S0U4H8_LOALO|nr:hypothetical protein LOAG_04124 [Loa loa]EFO24360.1 hypothetical protein LOAG_04124 [Loa loa]